MILFLILIIFYFPSQEAISKEGYLHNNFFIATSHGISLPQSTFGSKEESNYPNDVIGYANTGVTGNLSIGFVLFNNNSKDVSLGLVSNLNYSINEYDIPIDNAPVYWTYAGLYLGTFFSYSFDYFGIKIEPLTFGINFINHPKLIDNGKTIINPLSDIALSYKPEIIILKEIDKTFNIKTGTSLYIANPKFKSESTGHSMNVNIINLNIFLGVEYYF